MRVLILAELRKRYRVEIIEAPTLDDALFEFTGKRFREKKADLSISLRLSGHNEDACYTAVLKEHKA